MRKLFFFLSVVGLTTTQLFAQRVVEDNFAALKVHYSTPELSVKACDGIASGHVVLGLDGYVSGGTVGSPACPVLSSYIEVPFCDELRVSVENAVFDTVDLGSMPVIPMQPSRSKSDRSEPTLVKNASVYATDAFVGSELAEVQYVGIARDRNLALLSFSPVSVNPVTGKAIVCRSADVTVSYVGSDEQYTRQYYSRYHTPAFSATTTINSILSPKDFTSTAPVRYVIVVPESLKSTAINNFAEWKRTQGMRVDFIEVQNGATANSILESIQSLYTNATTADPAPTYVLLVGDNEQLKAFNSKIQSSGGWWGGGPDTDHITDLYYVSWTSGDNIPDAYIGRFSATDTITVGRIVAKTRYYERYDFADDSYLGRAALVAGEDNGSHQTSGWTVDNAWIYSDPSMDYIAKTYVNAENGFTDVRYYKNNVDFAPEGVTVTGYCSDASSATALRNLYSEGMGWVNYSAHGDWDCWHKPSFTVSNVSSMSNSNKPSFMIGNCCLTNKFEKSVCFGEALLRKGDKAGAVGYIGGTNSTYWTEDFYWSVGVRGNISNLMNTNYNASNLGMYDHLFHTHNEALAEHAVTAGKLMMAGNMAVQAGSSDAEYKTYYWEIYELMGDPSLMPWLGVAKDLPVSINLTNAVWFHTVPGAYVAIVSSTNNQVIYAGFTNSNGDLSLDRPANLNNVFFSITAQGYKPYIKTYSEAGVGIADTDAEGVAVYPNPANDRIYVQAKGLRRVELLNTLGQPVLETTGSVVDIQGVAAGLYFVRVSTATGTSLKKLVVK